MRIWCVAKGSVPTIIFDKIDSEAADKAIDKVVDKSRGKVIEVSIRICFLLEVDNLELTSAKNQIFQFLIISMPNGCAPISG